MTLPSLPGGGNQLPEPPSMSDAAGGVQDSMEDLKEDFPEPPSPAEEGNFLINMLNGLLDKMGLPKMPLPPPLPSIPGVAGLPSLPALPGGLTSFTMPWKL